MRAINNKEYDAWLFSAFLAHWWAHESLVPVSAVGAPGAVYVLAWLAMAPPSVGAPGRPEQSEIAPPSMTVPSDIIMANAIKAPTIPMIVCDSMRLRAGRAVKRLKGIYDYSPCVWRTKIHHSKIPIPIPPSMRAKLVNESGNKKKLIGKKAIPTKSG